MIKYDVIKINNKNIQMIPKGCKMNVPKELDNVSLSKNIEKVIEKIKPLISGIPSKGYFNSFAENFVNSNPALRTRSISLCIERDESVEGNALLLLSLLHPNKPSEASVMLTCGKPEVILEYLNKPESKEEILKNIKEIDKTF